MDAFYASVEQRDFPEYRGKPVVVGGSPEGRGVVAAASYEVRKFGVHSAMPSSKARRLCPQAIFIKPRFDIYREVSNQIRNIFFEFTDLVEPLSLDEAYLDVTENHLDNPSATLIACEIRKRIKEQTKLTASAGVAGNKFLAKVASDLNKPNGMAVITPDKAEGFLEALDIRDFHGIGTATEAKMKALGIESGKDLKKWTEIELVNKFGKVGRHYYRIVRGVDHRPVKPHRIRKSIGKERTFPDDIDDLPWIHSFLDELSEKVAAAMQKREASGKTVTLKVRYDDFETITRSTSYSYHIDSADAIAESAKRLLDQTEVGDRKVRLLGITLSNLNLDQRDHFKQLEIFTSHSIMNHTLSDFDYNLPKKLIAQQPAHPRDHARLLIYDRSTQAITDDYFYNLINYLPAETTLVANNSKVEKCRLLFDEGKKEIFVLDAINNTTVKAMVRPGKKFRKGGMVSLTEDISATVLDIDEEGLRTLRLNPPLEHKTYDQHRYTPFPPYIEQDESLSDEYQTIYARTDASGSSKAAPTAGLHFTDGLWKSISQSAIQQTEIMLHVGLGTFAPVKDSIEEHTMHEEWYKIDPAAARKLTDAAHITAVGTTAVRTLESNRQHHESFQPEERFADIFIKPGYTFQAVDALITNFHLPKSTLLMLVAAFMGYDEMTRVYKHAVDQQYRFYSFGDAMLIL